MTRPPVLYTDNPSVLVADVRDHFAGQRNVTDGRRIRLQATLDQIGPDDVDGPHALWLKRAIAECRDELVHLDRLLAAVDVIHRSFTAKAAEQ